MKEIVEMPDFLQKVSLGAQRIGNRFKIGNDRANISYHAEGGYSGRMTSPEHIQGKREAKDSLKQNLEKREFRRDEYKKIGKN